MRIPFILFTMQWSDRIYLPPNASECSTNGMRMSPASRYTTSRSGFSVASVKRLFLNWHEVKLPSVLMPAAGTELPLVSKQRQQMLMDADAIQEKIRSWKQNCLPKHGQPWPIESRGIVLTIGSKPSMPAWKNYLMLPRLEKEYEATSLWIVKYSPSLTLI